MGLPCAWFSSRSMPGWSIDVPMREAMAEYLVEHGISRECVVVEN
ncbi:hypothetical protein HMPREF9582_02460 [Cutibacterium acnes HL060PA1]|nr:hypothetical protein HMPREF9619_01079 [Cutibacterium acnes HL082PA2]EFT65498.1 hypothetical protein HMPREF9582_02460 [Cutibacterium acnes HL060PA1]EFT75026.1 hypothetical protein HMPREF9599_00440 [Cutibacterium acnes HL050PA2]